MHLVGYVIKLCKAPTNSKKNQVYVPVNLLTILFITNVNGWGSKIVQNFKQNNVKDKKHKNSLIRFKLWNKDRYLIKNLYV